MPKPVTYAKRIGLPARLRFAQYENGQDRKADRAWYQSERWRGLRALVLREQHYLCAAPGCPREAKHVHHIQERKDRPDLSYTRSNLEGLCVACHNRKRIATPPRGDRFPFTLPQ